MPPPGTRLFTVTPDLAARTVPAALRHWMPDASWSRVRELIKGRRILVNGNLCLDEGRRLKPGETVHVTPFAQNPLPTAGDVTIRHLDAQVVVVEKPAGMTTLRHASEKFWSARRKRTNLALADVLPSIIAKKERRPHGKGPLPRVRPVHRIDRETSGLLVFARTVPAEEHLIRQFKEHTTQRKYLALAIGFVEARTIESELVDDRGDGRRGSTTLIGTGKHAVTHVRPVEHLDGYTLVECRLETGRTHQIRIHLSEAGHPLCGDRTYQQPFGKPRIEDRSGAPRVALHAAELGFVHPATGKKMHFRSALPEDLAALLARLRGR